TEFADQLTEMVRWWLRRPPELPPRPVRDTSGRPPIRGVLLEDLPDGGSADIAVTQYDPNTFIQNVKIIGDVSGGTFTLSFQNQPTSPIKFNATAAELQAILEAHPLIGKGNVTVQLGKMTYTDR